MKEQPSKLKNGNSAPFTWESVWLDLCVGAIDLHINPEWITVATVNGIENETEVIQTTETK